MHTPIRVMLFVLSILVLGGCESRDPQSNHATLRLGEEQRVKELYSYPNNCNVVVCFQDESLSETVKRWFDSSILRDGFDAKTSVREEQGLYYIDIELSDQSKADDLDIFLKRYEQFLGHGDTAIQLARDFHAEKRWLPNWRFILPHGLPMTNNRSLEVMNFPPVSLVLKTQDYDRSATTDRWMNMLTENGVKWEERYYYGAILDIVPVAAPANEGWKLKQQKIYDGSFNGYAMPMLEMWTEVAGSNHSKPVMTLGAEMKIWFNDNYNTGFDKILDVAQVKVSNDRSAPIMFTNHPSKILYSKTYKQAIAIMDQDAVAACWQAKMGMSPGTDPNDMKTQCATEWNNKPLRKCELVRMQVCLIDESSSDESQKCKTMNEVEARTWCEAQTGDNSDSAAN